MEIEGDHSQNTESEVGDRAVGDEFFNVLLHPGDEGAVDDPDNAKAAEEMDDVRKGDGVGGEQADGNGEADKAISSELKKDAGKDNAARRGSFGVGQGKPSVHGKERDLHGEAGEKGEKNPVSFGLSQRGSGIFHDCLDVERPGVVAEIDHAGEGEEGAGEREEEEFPGGVAALGAAPDSDDEEHRDEGKLEEDVENEDVAGNEDAEHRSQQQQHPRVILAWAVLDAFKAGGDGQGHQQRGEQDKPEGNGIDAEGKRCVDRKHEGRIVEVELEPGYVEMETAESDEGDE